MQATPMFTEEGTVLRVYMLPLSHSEWVHVVEAKGLMRRTEDGPDWSSICDAHLRITVTTVCVSQSYTFHFTKPTDGNLLC